MWGVKKPSLCRPRPFVVLPGQTPRVFHYLASRGTPLTSSRILNILCINQRQGFIFHLQVYWINPVTPTGLMAWLNPAALHHPGGSDRLLSFSQAVLVLSTPGSWCSQNGTGLPWVVGTKAEMPLPASHPHQGTLNSSHRSPIERERVCQWVLFLIAWTGGCKLKTTRNPRLEK